MLLAAASQLVLAALMYRQRSTGLSAMAIGFVLFLVALLVTLLIEVPIDHQIKTWTLDALPAHWMELRDKWERFHKRTDRLDLGSLG
jgi:peptidoglycan/LPS O-acetylase OafA/YrhL